jgi:hypothetical protein
MVNIMSQLNRTFLSGIAMLFLATGTATAQTSKVELPNEILGTWCNDWSAYTTAEVEGEYHYWHADDKDECGNRGGMTISQQSIEYHRFDWSRLCKIMAIAFSRKADPARFPPFRRPDSRPGDDDLLKKGAPLTDVYLIRIDCKQEDEGENDEDIFEIQAGEYLITWDSPGS